ncbi:M56 family metallopeptidase [Mucilaginibacter auburnensis]|uniref:TonB-dependent receptor-like protein n=1 Tax=Mucilaginibacter auburnensis TaxID=1457233 RepID=A0A2H9VNK2_9SPHI|nr:M56 family metallopeptidase [Mucilaginibacter auburnensis]PJJ79906.1 TonB-dependent receptor-like protein [Mucilaginibacter auburnensis]
MPELFSILIKINIALVLFCGGYYMVLRKLTFYTLNRVYLVAAILLSSIYPFIDLSGFAQQHQQIVEPVQEIVIYWEAPINHIAQQSSYWNWLTIAFWIGAALFAGRLMLQMLSLYSIYSRSKSAEINGQKVRVVNGDISPFSFWQSIYLNPENLSDADVKNILEHEQIHVKEWHTLDILLSEISLIFYWFNPGVWMMKKAVRENIEFITDRKILQKGTDSKAYQYSLLNVTFNQPAPAITSNFNFSTLKKRIIMMNAERSSNLNLTRYALLVPVVIVCLLTLTLAKAQTLKIDKVFKQIAVAVEEIGPVSFNADTVPVKKKPATTVDKTTPREKTLVVEQTPQPLLSTTNAASNSIVARGLAGDDSLMIIVNNKLTNNINSINPNNIRSVTVIKSDIDGYINKITGLSFKSNSSIKGLIHVITQDAPDIPQYPNSELSNELKSKGYVEIRRDSTTFFGRRVVEGKEPLIVINGTQITDLEKFQNMDQNDIQSVTVLKGESGTKLYGDKAKNGVIVIITKNAK